MPHYPLLVILVLLSFASAQAESPPTVENQHGSLTQAETTQKLRPTRGQQEANPVPIVQDLGNDVNGWAEGNELSKIVGLRPILRIDGNVDPGDDLFQVYHLDFGLTSTQGRDARRCKNVLPRSLFQRPH
jgi:hypothetical protein